MKKILVAILVLLMIIVPLTSCKNANNNGSDSSINSYVQDDHQNDSLKSHIYEFIGLDKDDVFNIVINYNNNHYEIYDDDFIKDFISYLENSKSKTCDVEKYNYANSYGISLVSSSYGYFHFYVNDDDILQIFTSGKEHLFLYKKDLFDEVDMLLKPIMEENDKFYSVKYNDSEFTYSYKIFDKRGNVIESGEIMDQPNISYRGNDVVCKWVQTGIGCLVRGTDFYDINTGKKSPHYSGIVDSYNNLVANSTNKSVVISDMFTGRVLQVIDNFSMELYDGIEPIVDLKFIEDGTKVEITYLPVGYENATEIFKVDITQQIGSDNELLSVMRNEKSFLDEKGNQTYFRDYDLGFSQKFDVKAEKYVIFDIDDDCKNELIVGIKNVDNFIILDHDEGKIYGHNTWLRSFNCLNNNGTFLQSGGAGLNSIASIEFDKTNKKIIEIAEKDDYDKIYKHYGEIVSRETVDEVFDSFNKSQQCEWTLEE